MSNIPQNKKLSFGENVLSVCNMEWWDSNKQHDAILVLYNMEARLCMLPCAAEKSISAWGRDRADIQRSLSLLLDKAKVIVFSAGV